MSENSILVCGNGPSLCDIDFRRVNKSAKVMRVTNFFLEEKYYAGRRVDYYLDYAKRLEQQYFNVRTVKTKGEYDVDLENIWMTVMFEDNIHFPIVKDATGFIQKTPLIAEFRNFYEYYYKQYLPTGMQAIALATCLGFENVYLAGFDLFSDPNNIHPFKTGSHQERVVNNLKPTGKYDTAACSSGSEYEHSHKYHPKHIQIEFLNLLKEIFSKTNIVSVTPSSPINNTIPIAPIIYDMPWYEAENKGDDRTKDWYVIPDFS